MKAVIVFLALLFLSSGAYAQVYIDDLVNHDFDSFTAKVKLLDLNLKKIPILRQYIETAGSRSDPQIVKKLLELGANPNLEVPLFEAIGDKVNPVIVQYLLSAGARMKVADHQDLYSFIEMGLDNDPIAFKTLVVFYKYNMSLPKKQRLEVPKDSIYIAQLVPFIEDNVELVKKTFPEVSRANNLDRGLEIAVAAKSLKTVDLLLKLDNHPFSRESSFDTRFLWLIFESPELIKVFEDNGVDLKKLITIEWMDSSHHLSSYLTDLYVITEHMLQDDPKSLDNLVAFGLKSKPRLEVYLRFLNATDRLSPDVSADDKVKENLKALGYYDESFDSQVSFVKGRWINNGTSTGKVLNGESDQAEKF